MQETPDRDLAERGCAAAAEAQFADQQLDEYGRTAKRSGPHRNSAEADLEKHEEQHADDQAAGLPALSQRTDDAQGDQRLPQLAEAV